MRHIPEFLLRAALPGVLAILCSFAPEPSSEWGDRIVACGDSNIVIINAKASTSDSLVIEKRWDSSRARGMVSDNCLKLLRKFDECKPVAGGTKLLITGSTGGCALLDLRSDRVMFYASAKMAHSAELLPGGRIAIASSVHKNGNSLGLYEIGKDDICLWKDSLYFGHGVVWSEKYQRLYALGFNELRSYKLKNWDSPNPELELEKAYSLPGKNGHDLSMAGEDRLLISGDSVWMFDIPTSVFSVFGPLAKQRQVKSVNYNPLLDRLIYTKAENRWWTNHIYLTNPDKVLSFPKSFHLYKARVMDSENDRNDIPDYFTEYLDARAQAISRVQEDEADGFYFWTDPHYPNNGGNSVSVLKYLQSRSASRKVFLGGDIAAISDNLQFLMDWMDEDLRKLESFAPVYFVRGNHEFSIAPRTKGRAKIVLSNKEAVGYARKHIAPDAVFNRKDSVSCYYYLDNPQARIRYVIMDTSNGIREDGGPVTDICEPQRKWLARAMTRDLPKGWKILTISHIPLSGNISKAKALTDMADFITDLPQGTDLIHLSGHKHFDITSAFGDIFEVMTASDCLSLSAPGITSEWHKPDYSHNVGDWSEQRFDYISISKDFSKIRFIHIGYGQDQTFNINVKNCKGKSVSLETSLKGNVKWYIHDAYSGRQLRSPGGGRWECGHTLASIDGNGKVSPNGKGLSIAVAVDEKGNREFFMVKND